MPVTNVLISFENCKNWTAQKIYCYKIASSLYIHADYTAVCFMIITDIDKHAWLHSVNECNLTCS